MRVLRTTLLLSAVMLCALLAHPALGQLTDTLRVVSFSIADGSAGVAINTQVRITFNHSVDPEYLGEVFSAQPEEAIDISGAVLENEGRTVVLTVEHEADTDYMWLGFGFYETYDDDFEVVESMSVEPFVVHYTTAASIGTLSVSGMVVEAGVGADALAKRAAQSVEPVLPKSLDRAVREHVRQERSQRQAVVHSTAWATAAAQARFDHTLVFLLDRSYLFEDEGDDYALPLAGTVAAVEDGAYTVQYLRDGIVWPFVIRMGDPNDLLGLLEVGFYDPNEDGVPDSVDLAGSDKADIDITLFDVTFSLYDQAGAQTVADAAIASAGEGQVLVGITADYMLGDGKAAEWTFYYRDGEDVVTEVYVYSLDEEAEVYSWGDVSSEGTPLLDTYVSMAAAHEVARENGGDVYESGAGFYYLAAIAGSYAQEEYGIGDLIELPDVSEPYWTFFYLVIDENAEFGISYAGFFVDMATGASLGASTPTGSEAPVQPERVQLSGGYPNPFRDEVAFTLYLQTASHVRAAAYDVLGREVHVLMDGVLAGDTHTLRWDAASMPAGVYFVRVEAAGQMMTQPVVLQR